MKRACFSRFDSAAFLRFAYCCRPLQLSVLRVDTLKDVGNAPALSFRMSRRRALHFAVRGGDRHGDREASNEGDGLLRHLDVEDIASSSTLTLWLARGNRTFRSQGSNPGSCVRLAEVAA